MLSYDQILTISIGVLFALVIGLYFVVVKLRRILYAVRRNVNIVDVEPTAEMITYAKEQRDKYHWSHPKYKAYEDTLRRYGAL